MSIWDDPDVKPEESRYVKLTTAGDKFSGVITDIRKHRFDDNSVKPQLIFTDDRDGEESTWTAGQVQAVRQLTELRPGPGDWFSAELTRVEKRGTKELKHISVEVKPAAAVGAKSSAKADDNDKPPF